MATGIGERIRSARLALGWSQEYLANRMGLKSKSTICKVERGDDNLTSAAVEKYAKALWVSPAQLMGWDDNKSPDENAKCIPDTEHELQAKRLYLLYEQASPEIQSAVELLLKSAQSKP